MTVKTKASLAQRLAAKKPVSTTHEVVLDYAPMKAVEEAESALRQTRLFGKPEDIAEKEAAVEEAKRAAEEADASVTLHLQGLPRDAYEALLLAHPPTAEQKKRQEAYDVETFSAAVVALCIVDPEVEATPITAKDVESLASMDDDEQREFLAALGRPMSPADLAEAWSTWNQGEQGSLYQAALSVCTQARNPSLPFG